MSSHPDKVPETERAEAEIRFKAVSQAYEILYDDEKRNLYDQHGMAAFEKGSGGPGGMGPEVDLDDILQQMFGMGMGGAGGMPGMGGGGRPAKRKRAKGPSEEQEYEVTLQELYKGKTTHFTSTKNVLCSACSGTGGKEKAKAKTCETCKGNGTTTRLQQVGPGLVSPTTVTCSTCSGHGEFYRDKDRCKRCKGACVVQSKKKLELYIPPGSREGEHIILAGEADQSPDWQEPGDIVFLLIEKQHEVFTRAGPDLQADVRISLTEALMGFSRVVVKQLDGRGIKITVPKGKVMKPGQILRVHGEGMPLKRSDAKGDLYLQIEVEFPEDGWMASAELPALLPKSTTPPVHATEVDEVEYEADDVDMNEFGGGSDDPRGGAAWEDDEEEVGADPGCQQQ